MNPTWLDNSEYPFRSNYYAVNGHQLHYIDEGSGEILLFVHGTPSWSFDFRNVIKKLSSKYRCIAIDHIGFGLSDKPEHYDYSTKNHSRTLEKFILDNNLENLTIVVHDFGGPIGFSAMMNHHERIKKIIVLNSWLWSSKNDPDFIKISKILSSPLLPFLYRNFNFSAKYILPKSFGEKKLSAHIKKQFTKPFANRKERNGTIAFAQSLLHDQDWFEELWNKRNLFAAKPALLIWGMNDPVIKREYLEKFKEGFPIIKSVEINTAGHFPQEEEPEIVARCIEQFISEN